MKRYEIYKCETCGSLVEVLQDGEGVPYCHGKPMTLLEAKSADVTTEKHVPYVERVDGKYVVKVGKEQKHPMQPEHYIVFIELIVDGVVYRKYLKPGDEPMAEFEVPEGKEVWAREYCNIHGLWEKK